MTVPTLVTPRLILRPWRDDDLDAFAALNADAEVMAYFPSPLDRAASDDLAARIRVRMAESGFGLWAVEAPGVAPFIGFTGLAVPTFTAHFTRPDEPATEIGWRMARACWGRGYATEAARAALAFGFESLDLHEIVSFTAAGNHRSRAVMHRLGMTHTPADDFEHPLIPHGHALRPHVLYRVRSG